MKKIFLVIAACLCAIYLNAQTTIVMEKDGGVYKIPCKVNGAKMKMIFDTGASAVSISSFMANYLYENDYLSGDDIIGTGTSSIANGAIINHTKIILRDIEIEGLHLTNVEAVVVESQDAPLLLGQSAIQQLGAITLDENRLTINNYSSGIMSSETMDSILISADEKLRSGAYSEALRDYLLVDEQSELSSIGQYRIILCLNNLGDYNHAIKRANQYAYKYQDVDVRSNMGNNRLWILFELAKSYLKLGRDYQALDICTQIWENTPIIEDTYQILKLATSVYLSTCVDNNYYPTKFTDAGMTFFRVRLKQDNKSICDLTIKIEYDEEMADLCYWMLCQKNAENDMEESIHWAILGARKGNSVCRSFCNTMSINYNNSNNEWVRWVIKRNCDCKGCR